jgi:solute carrier family 25 S-adenosylmethionine transporter 26
MLYIQSLLILGFLLCSFDLIGCNSIPIPLITDQNKKHVIIRPLASLPTGVKNGIASGLAAAVVKAILQPFDTIKTVQQTQKVFMGPLQTAAEILKNRGIAGLWSGLGVTVFGSSPSVALYFGCYSSAKNHLSKVLPESMNLVAVAVSAAFGNTVASVLRVPYEVVKQRLQAGLHQSTWEAIIHISKTEGLVGLFAGGKLASQMLRDIPYAIATLLSYEILQKNIANRFQSKKMKDAVCGLLAGGLGAAVTNPMDVIKTRMMVSDEYGSILVAIKRMTDEEGLQAFSKGLGPRLMHKIPANGIFFLVYETFKGWLDST